MGVENFCTKLPKGTPLRQIWSNKSFGVCGSDCILALYGGEKKVRENRHWKLDVVYNTVAATALPWLRLVTKLKDNPFEFEAYFSISLRRKLKWRVGLGLQYIAVTKTCNTNVWQRTNVWQINCGLRNVGLHIAECLLEPPIDDGYFYSDKILLIICLLLMT